MTCFAALSTGCPGNTGSAGNGVSSGTGEATKSTPFGGTVGGTLPSGSTVNTINANKVVRSNLDPTTLIEFISSDNSIGLSCNSVNDCACEFSWINSAGQNRQAEQKPVSRVEANLLRCLFTQVDADAKYFDVFIQIRDSNAVSNTIRVFMPVQNPSLDPSLNANYLPVQRYMCRDIVRKNQNTQYYQGTILDPQLWDKSLSFNFFSTNLGNDYGARPSAGANGAAQAVPGWECPLIPNDPSDSNFGGAPFYDYQLFSLAPVNIAAPNNAPVAVGDNTIFPVSDNLGNSASCPTGDEATCEQFQLNRHDFSLARFGNGIFKIPVCIPHKVANLSVSPSLNCQFDSSKGQVVLGSSALAGIGSDIIGFAAVPDSQEQCPAPNAVAIPPNKKWAKVWQFRTSIPVRMANEITNVNSIGDLFCTTRSRECFASGLDTDAAIANSATSVCHDETNPLGTNLTALGAQFAFFGASGGPTQGYGNCADRNGAIIGDNNPPAGGYNVVSDTAPAPLGAGVPCFSPTSGLDCCHDNGKLNITGSSVAPNVNTNRPANYTASGQWCNPALHGSINSEKAPQNGQDVWLMGNGDRRACIEADTDNGGKLVSAFGATAFPPPISNPYVMGTKQLDQDSRSDLIYVVTPAWVKFSDMQHPESNPIARQYTPWRRHPLAPGSQLIYGLESGSLNTAGGVSRLSYFPLCVLQDAKKGAVPKTSGAP